MIIDDNSIQAILVICTTISTVWAIRSHLKAYQKETSNDVEEKTILLSQVLSLSEKVEQLDARVFSLEDERHEVRVLTERVDSIYKELDKKIDNLIAFLVGKK